MASMWGVGSLLDVLLALFEVVDYDIEALESSEPVSVIGGTGR